MNFLSRLFAPIKSMAEVGLLMHSENAKDAKKRLKRAGYYDHDFIQVGYATEPFHDHEIFWYWCRDCGKYFEKYMAYGGLMKYEEETREETLEWLRKDKDKILKEEKAILPGYSAARHSPLCKPRPDPVSADGANPAGLRCMNK